MQTIRHYSVTHRRRGTVLVFAMIGLIIFGMTTAALMQTLGFQRDVVQSDSVRTQTEWLLQSALQRTVVKLRKQADYPGEKWSVPADSLGSAVSAAVDCKVTPIVDQPKRRQIVIHVEYQRSDVVIARLTKSFDADLPQ